MITKITFTAYNKSTGKREQFECNMLDLLHTDSHDAATSKLWYGELWSREQIEAADIIIIRQEIIF